MYTGDTVIPAGVGLGLIPLTMGIFLTAVPMAAAPGPSILLIHEPDLNASRVDVGHLVTSLDEVAWQPSRTWIGTQGSELSETRPQLSSLASTTWGILDPEVAYVAEEIIELASYEDGWKGQDSLGASEQATGDVKTLVRQLAAVPGRRMLPMVGLDDEGVYSLTWDDDVVLGSLSVFGDGTYAYSLRRDGDRIADGRARIVEPLSEAFVRFLTV